MNLLVDIGNSRLKWAIEKAGELQSGSPINYHQQGLLSELELFWSDMLKPDQLVIASVSAGQIVSEVIEYARGLWPDIKVNIAKSTARAYAVKNAYQQPERLGVDRWLALIAGQTYYSGGCCIVDCGTAITIDCLDNSGLHQGGLIAPGLQLMKQSLFQGTARLSLTGQEFTAGLADSTEPAIYSGTLFAATGLIEKVVREFGHFNTIVLTGGDAEKVASALALDVIIDPDLILKGLSVYCLGEK